jgi:hypothetical protein
MTTVLAAALDARGGGGPMTRSQRLKAARSRWGNAWLRWRDVMRRLWGFLIIAVCAIGSSAVFGVGEYFKIANSSFSQYGALMVGDPHYYALGVFLWMLGLLGVAVTIALVIILVAMTIAANRET